MLSPTHGRLHWGLRTGKSTLRASLPESGSTPNPTGKIGTAKRPSLVSYWRNRS